MTLKTMEIKIIKSIQPTVFGTSVLIPPSASSDELINGSLAVGETIFYSNNDGQRSYSLTRRSKVYRRPTRVLGTKKLGAMLFFWRAPGMQPILRLDLLSVPVKESCVKDVPFRHSHG